VLGSYPVQIAAPVAAPSSGGVSRETEEAGGLPLEAEILGFGPRSVAATGASPSSARPPLSPALRQNGGPVLEQVGCLSQL
jgi:hypothetical protein